MDKKFNLDYQYSLYLKRVDLDENKMPETQKTETKQAFMGACGQILVLLVDDLSEIDEDKACEILQDMLNQVGQYFKLREIEFKRGKN